MNTENLFLCLFVLATAYGFIITIAFMAGRILLDREKNHNRYLKADIAQLKQVLKEYTDSIDEEEL